MHYYNNVLIKLLLDKSRSFLFWTQRNIIVLFWMGRLIYSGVDPRRLVKINGLASASTTNQVEAWL